MALPLSQKKSQKLFTINLKENKMYKILITTVGSLLFAYVIVSLTSTKRKRNFKELSKKLLKEGEYMDRDLIDIYALLQEGKNDEALESLINYVVKNK